MSEVVLTARCIHLTVAKVLAVSAYFLTSATWAGNATKDDVVKMVKRGVAEIKAAGTAKTYAEITDREHSKFVDRDLYLVVYRNDGVVLAHGANAKMVGKNLIGLKDIDGKAFVQERVDMAKTHATFWQDYKFTNPETKKIEPKQMYCERLGDTVVCGGIYK